MIIISGQNVWWGEKKPSGWGTVSVVETLEKPLWGKWAWTRGFRWTENKETVQAGNIGQQSASVLGTGSLAGGVRSNRGLPVILFLNELTVLRGLSPLAFQILCRTGVLVAAESGPTLYPVDCSPPGSSVLRIFQARILKWVAIFFSRGSSWPRDRTRVCYIAGGFFTYWAPGKPKCQIVPAYLSYSTRSF